MNVPFGDSRREVEEIRPEIEAAIRSVLDSGWFILGKNVKRFEKAFAEYCGVQHAVGVGSGTEALHLALVACGVGHGDEVITVVNTAVPTASAISFAGARPVFVDVEPDTLLMNPDLLEKAITPKTKAVVPVHLFGQMADVGKIVEIAHAHGIPVVEDACQAHGAEWHGKRPGQVGDLAAYSFYPSKNLGAYGDGGAVVTNNAELAERVWLLRNYGQKKRYYHSIVGFNSRLDEMQAAILAAKLPHLDAWNQRRRELAQRYLAGLRDAGVVLPVEAPGRKHVYHLFVIRHPQRDALQAHLEARGVKTLIHYPVPVHLQEAYRFLGYSQGSFPVAEQAAGEILSLPMFPQLREEEVDYVVERIRDFTG